jgi:hypothetical protein
MPAWFRGMIWNSISIISKMRCSSWNSLK